jgi:rRNA-processing protein EBP2
MARKGKLLAALEAHQGRDIEAEKRKKQVKAAEKRKREKAERKALEAGDDKELVSETNGVAAEAEDTFANFSDEEDEVNGTTQVAAQDLDMNDDNDDEDEEDEEDDADSDVALSDLSATDAADTIPHQRLTINNGPALLSSQSRIALLRKQPLNSKMPFQLHNSLISTLPASSTAIPDVDDDLTRELEFYRIARTAVLSARTRYHTAKIPFSRPADYFAEMVKSDTHMDRIKKKLYNEAAEKKGREEARRQRDAKKFGKQVQVAKMEERAKMKRDTLEKVRDLKRSKTPLSLCLLVVMLVLVLVLAECEKVLTKPERKGTSSDNVIENPDEDPFSSITVEKPGAKSTSGRERGRGDGPNRKRQRKDAKFGFGGKKRFAKSSDASSSGDMRGFSTSRMKEGGRSRGGGGRGRGAKRLGKSRRAR